MKKGIQLSILTLSLFSAGLNVYAQEKPMSQRIAATIMKNMPSDTSAAAGGKPFKKWNYDEGVILKGIEGVWLQTADRSYFKYIQQSMDNLINADGTEIKGYKSDDYTLDNILCGRNMLMLYNTLGTAKYLTVANTLYDQLKKQPRTPEGGFWHKKRYVDQMWLDGLYMAESFYAEYAAEFHHEADFDDIAKQYILMEQHARDAKTGLLYHGWDYSKKKMGRPKNRLVGQFLGPGRWLVRHGLS